MCEVQERIGHLELLKSIGQLDRPGARLLEGYRLLSLRNLLIHPPPVFGALDTVGFAVGLLWWSLISALILDKGLGARMVGAIMLGLLILGYLLGGLLSPFYLLACLG
jgi:hypothetical protein